LKRASIDGLIMKSETQLVVVGLGFVGLACLVGFHKLGVSVVGIDNNLQKINDLKNLCFEDVEQEIADYIKKNPAILDSIHTELDNNVSASKLISLICVGTPNFPDGTPNLEIVKSCIKDLCSNKNISNHEVVIKSTVPPTTINNIIKPYIKKNISKKISFVSNPEFLREGTALADFLKPDRIVLGQEEDSSEIEKIYSKYFDCIYKTDFTGAEFCKYYSNCALALMISFSNEMRLYADELGIKDLKNIFNQFHQDRRWFDSSMKSYFWPGIGYGGYCLPKDSNAFLDNMKNNNFKSEVLSSVVSVNEHLLQHFRKCITEKFSRYKRVIFFGSSFKVGSDDIRESKTLELINSLEKVNFDIYLLEDNASLEISRKYGYSLVRYDAINTDDGIVVMLKNKDYLKFLQNHDREHIVDIPFLLDT